MPPNTLEVRLYGRRAGTLHRGPQETFRFQYDTSCDAALHAPPPLSTTLPCRSEPYSAEESMRWFTGLLSEDGRGRELQALVKAENTGALTLLASAGAECAGAVQIVNERSDAEQPWLDTLDADALHELVERETGGDRHERYRAAGISLAGAQPKLALYRDDDGAWSVPRGGHPSTTSSSPTTAGFPRWSLTNTGA